MSMTQFKFVNVRELYSKFTWTKQLFHCFIACLSILAYSLLLVPCSTTVLRRSSALPSTELVLFTSLSMRLQFLPVVPLRQHRTLHSQWHYDRTYSECHWRHWRTWAVSERRSDCVPSCTVSVLADHSIPSITTPRYLWVCTVSISSPSMQTDNVLDLLNHHQLLGQFFSLQSVKASPVLPLLSTTHTHTLCVSSKYYCMWQYSELFIKSSKRS